MILAALLWAAGLLGEGLAYVPFANSFRRFHRMLCVAGQVLNVVGTLLLLTHDWLLWLVPTLIGLYRFINTARYLAARLPLQQLSIVSLRAHIWFVLLQLAVVGVGIAMRTMGLAALSIAAIAQLFCALILLRASLHTWRHALLFTPAEPLADSELPTLSVLIPARNETELLDRCLQQLLASNYPKLEIIVLDDNSTTRRTSEIIRGFAHDGVRFVQGAVADERNWLAKNQAYARLAEEASGDLLLFCGVDAMFAPGSLRQLVQLLQYKKKDMLSVLPLRDATVRGKVSLLQPMRYYWELCLPRRFFKRPPVMSTCWIIRTDAFKRAGGFRAVSRAITPEAYFARQAVVNDAYSFLRGNEELGVYSAKAIQDQYDTSVRVRYPQLHRRLELVAMVTLLELLVFIGPIVGLSLCWLVPHSAAYALIWLVAIACLEVTYYLAAAETHISSVYTTWALMPLAFVSDVIVQHISLFKYEFSRVEWKGRDAAVPVMRVTTDIPALTKVI